MRIINLQKKLSHDFLWEINFLFNKVALESRILSRGLVFSIEKLVLV